MTSQGVIVLMGDFLCCPCRPPVWTVFVDMYLNLPYPHWYKQYCILNMPENELLRMEQAGYTAEEQGALTVPMTM